MAGVYAVIAMIINLFYVFGIMDSIDATLTLPVSQVSFYPWPWQ